MLDELRRRLRVLLRPGWFAEGLDEEMRHHLELQEEENRNRGMAAADARLTALRQFGNTAVLRERSRDVWGWRALDAAARDARHAFRTMRRAPAVTAAALLTLALGIGANTAIFSIADALLLRSLPVPQPDQLRIARQRTPEAPRPAFSMPAIATLSTARSIAAAGAYTTPGPALISVAGGEPETVHREQVSSGYFDALTLRPTAGRFFTPDEDRSPAAVAVISHSYWQRRFGGDPRAIGARLQLGSRAYTIIGIAPPRFAGVTPERPVSFWAPVGESRPQCLASAGCEAYKLLFRLAPGVTAGRAAAELNALFRGHLRNRAASVPENQRASLLARDLELLPGGAGDSQLGRQYRRPLQALLAIVAVLLLLACVNVGNMLLARAAARSREMAIRAAVGAGRGRLVRQLLVECLVLAFAGGALAIPFATWAAAAIVRAYTDPRLHLNIDVTPDWRILAYTATMSACAALVFGLLPAFRATRGDIAPRLKGGALPLLCRRIGAPRMLAAAQIALSIVLLAGAGLLIRSLSRLAGCDAGYSRNGVVAFSLGAPSGYANNADAAIWRLLDKVRTLPGVTAAGAASPPPPSGGPLFPVRIDGYQPNAGESMEVRVVDISEGFFEAVRTPLLNGRLPSAHDRGRKPAAVVVNESFARRFFASADPVGRLIHAPSNYAGGSVLTPSEIIGVVADARYAHPKEAPLPSVFPYSPALWASSIVVHTAEDPRTLLAALPPFVRESEPALRLSEAQPLSVAMDRMLMQERMLANLSGFFGALAIVLATVGVYGVLAYGVRQRSAEIAIRLALGAARPAVVWMVVRDSLVLLATGLAAGLPLAVLCGRALDALLFGLTPADPAAIGGAALLVALVSLLAGYAPARHASRIEPSTALRAE